MKHLSASKDCESNEEHKTGSYCVDPCVNFCKTGTQIEKGNENIFLGTRTGNLCTCLCDGNHTTDNCGAYCISSGTRLCNNAETGQGGCPLTNDMFQCCTLAEDCVRNHNGLCDYNCK
jgi:hypothetical protein